jgi:diguanylate cyclase (GGDEF)-like protein
VRLDPSPALRRIGVRARALAALAACLAILFLDIGTSAPLVAALLYIPVVGLFYRVEQRSAFVGFCIVATLFTAIGGWAELGAANFETLTIDRVMAILVICAMSFIVYRSGQSAVSLEVLATTDPLTGVLNRRRYLELMAREQRRADRYGTAYSVLMVDIDHFKRINDAHGHQIGDQALRAVAGGIGKMLRPTDIMARYGGEEFIVTLTHTDLAGSLTVAERLRRTVSETELATSQGPVRCTVSIGVSTRHQRAMLDHIIGAADRALYEAKASGRNRVCAATGQSRPLPS